MLKIRYFDVPAPLRDLIERPVAFDFTDALHFRWQFFPTGCWAMNLLVGPPNHDYELERPHDDGAFVGVPPHGIGTWCERRCIAFGVSFTPLGAVRLPLAANNFETLLALPYDALFGRSSGRALRSWVRDAPDVDTMMARVLRWVENMLLDSRPVPHGRAAAVAAVAQQMRQRDPPSLDEAARRVGVQRRQFERDFRRHLGLAPKRYEMVARVQQVGQLAWAGMPLVQIAAELGFTDQAHLSHVVKDITGMAPAELLQRAAKSPLAHQTRPFTGGRITHLDLAPA
jgi:AraC-like DNA-binding protein